MAACDWLHVTHVPALANVPADSYAIALADCMHFLG